MKSFGIIALAVTLAVVCLANSAIALPLEEEVQDVAVAAVVVNATEAIAPKQEAEAHRAVEEHSRHKRATCDLLSKFNVNHSACAAHCLLKGFKGGYCNSKQVCVCRR